MMQNIELGLQILGAIVVLATLIVRITPSKKDDEVVGKVEAFYRKLLKIAPTLGVNPQVKK